MKSAVPLLTLALGCLAGCEPNLDVHASRVTQARVVAVRATPAEARPGQAVTWDAVVVAPASATTAPQIDWAMCGSPRNPAYSITVTDACFGAVQPNPPAGSMPVVTAIAGASGSHAQGTIPADACRKIGPEVSAMADNGVRQRPPDADITGGYQLPIRLVLSGANSYDVSFDRQRVRCNLASAPADAAREYERRYKANENPAIAQILFGGVPSAPDGSARFRVPRGSRIPMAVAWNATAKETYVLFDPIERAIRERSETLEIAWFTNGGEFERDRTTPDGDQPSSSNALLLDTDLTLPVTVWIVLRDDRGGVGSAQLVIDPA